MKLNIDITREDYADFNKFHFMKTRLKQSIIAIVCTLLIVQYFLNSDGFDLMRTTVSSLFGIVVYIFILYRSYVVIKRIPLENGYILGKKEVEFTEERYFYKTRNSEASTGWDAIKSIEEGKTAFYLFMDTNMAMIIPKRTFKDESEMCYFKDLVTRKIQKA